MHCCLRYLEENLVTLISSFICICTYLDAHTKLKHTGPELYLHGSVCLSIFVQLYPHLTHTLCLNHILLQSIPDIHSSKESSTPSQCLGIFPLSVSYCVLPFFTHLPAKGSHHPTPPPDLSFVCSN